MCRCFNGHHAKTFRVTGQLAHGEDVQGRAFVGTGQLLRVGNHTQKTQMLADACGIGNAWGVARGLRYAESAGIRPQSPAACRAPDDGGQCVQHTNPRRPPVVRRPTRQNKRLSPVTWRWKILVRLRALRLQGKSFLLVYQMRLFCSHTQIVVFQPGGGLAVGNHANPAPDAPKHTARCGVMVYRHPAHEVHGRGHYRRGRAWVAWRS